MPIFEYKCDKCGKEFEELVLSSHDEPSCPECGQEQCQRQLSMSWGAAGSKGGTGMAKPKLGGNSSGCGSGGFK